MESNSKRQGVIKRERVRLAGTVARAHAAGPEPESRAAPATEDAAPRVHLLRLDEQTQAIEVTCSCGEVSLIEIRTEKKP